jgi:hypothetical protein
MLRVIACDPALASYLQETYCIQVARSSLLIAYPYPLHNIRIAEILKLPVGGRSQASILRHHNFEAALFVFNCTAEI